ncbi:hypothetical protein EI164_00770 [Psychrobacter sp. FME13]|uniref:hypothetical protein n=1 Tax=Psychrobacter sp. FME13 TaxID=2487708 RepID=UPI001787D028|nr:hypothetical protein [Psychrobacter sp. FME13]MBE0440611.1 hypothetical protein [Psychrobacter sp. FME13]
MDEVKACLKVKVNNNPSVIETVFDAEPRIPSNISMDQSVVASLLSGYFSEINPWGDFIANQGFIRMDEDGETSTKNLLGRYDQVFTSGGYAYPSEIGYVGFNDLLLKTALKNDLIGAGPLSGWSAWEELVDISSMDSLQDILDANINAGNVTYTIYAEPSTLTIERCTEEDIINSSMGQPWNIDAFDLVKDMLVGHLDDRDKEGYAPASYDPVADVITIKSNYRLERKEKFLT